MAAFSFLTLDDDQNGPSQFSTISMADISMLTMPEGEAIVDTAAGQNLIGEVELADLSACLGRLGVRPVMLDKEPRRARGIGGQAEAVALPHARPCAGNTLRDLGSLRIPAPAHPEVFV